MLDEIEFLWFTQQRYIHAYESIGERRNKLNHYRICIDQIINHHRNKEQQIERQSERHEETRPNPVIDEERKELSDPQTDKRSISELHSKQQADMDDAAHESAGDNSLLV